MVVHFITYGDNNFKNSKKRLEQEAKNVGWFDSISVFGPEDLDNEFKTRFKDVLKHSKGGGYWIWKPYIIKKKLDEIDNDDILIYLDAGCSINPLGKDRFDEYIDMLGNREEGVISFQMHHAENIWTNKKVFDYFNIDINSEVANSGQITGNTNIFKKNANSTKLVNLWYKCLNDDPLLFTDYYSNNQEAYFKAHRHDQSVFSLIRKIHRSILLTDEGYFKKFYSEESLKYPFWTTRKKC